MQRKNFCRSHESRLLGVIWSFSINKQQCDVRFILQRFTSKIVPLVKDFIAVSRCSPNPCFNGGACRETVFSLICHCVSGNCCDIQSQYLDILFPNIVLKFYLKWRKRLSIQYFYWPLNIIKKLDLSDSLTNRIPHARTNSRRAHETRLLQVIWSFSINKQQCDVRFMLQQITPFNAWENLRVSQCLNS